MSKISGWIGGVLATAVLVSACGDDKKTTGGTGGTGGPSGEIPIGSVISITGALADYGPPINNAITLAVTEINDAGGVLGKKLKLVQKDDNTDADKAKVAAQSLVDTDKVVGVIGGLASGGSIKIKEVTMTAGIPQISPASTSPALTEADNFFRTVPSDALQAKVLVKRAMAAGLTKVAIIYVNNPYGKGLNDAFTTGFMAGGGMVTASIPYEPMQASYSMQAQMALADAPNGIFLAAYPEEGAKIMQEAKNRGASAAQKWLFPDGLKAQSFIDNLAAAKPLAEGCIGTAPANSPAADDQARTTKFKAAFKAKFGADPGTYCDSAYDAVYLLAAAIQKAGDPATALAQVVAVSKGEGGSATEFGPGDWALAKAATGALNYQGAAGKLDLDASGEPSGFYGIYTVTNGRLVEGEVVEP